MSETQTTAKPLPCPFCGAQNVSIAEGSTYRWAHAECAECGAGSGDIRREYGQETDNPEVRQAAIAEWNIRDRREIDALTAQLAEAKLKADAWDAREAYIRIVTSIEHSRILRSEAWAMAHMGREMKHE